MLLACLSLLFFIPTFLYGMADSIVNEVSQRRESVYGSFNEIYYRDRVGELNPVTDNEFSGLFPNYKYESFGVFYTVKTHEIDGNRQLNVGFADDEALRLGAVYLYEGNFPKSDDEIALTRGNVIAMNAQIGQNVSIGEYEFTVSGIVNDFGRLWAQGELQLRDNISPVNAFVTPNKANELFNESFGVLQQIVIQATPSIVNPIEDIQRKFTNSNAGSGIPYNIPNHFRIIMQAISMLAVVSVLMLGTDRLLLRLKSYHLLGMETRKIKNILLFETFFLTAVSVVVGGVLGVIAAYMCLSFIFAGIGMMSIYSAALLGNLLLIAAMVLGFAVIYFVYSDKVLQKLSLESQTQEVKTYKLSERPISIFRFDFHKNLKTFALITTVICLSCVFISYGMTYGNYFTEEFETEQGFVRNDFDFQFSTKIPPPVPSQEIPLFFTDPFEQLGANSEFVQRVAELDGVSRVLSYRQSLKMNIITHEQELDEYFNTIYGLLGCTLAGSNDPNIMRETFGYNENQILLAIEMVGHTVEDLMDLNSVIAEGEINIDKLISGEEVILRVPAFKIVETDFGEFTATGIVPTESTAPEAINFSMLQVGDEITLSEITTEHFINGAVFHEDLSDFERHDVTVRIGAIIRDFEAVLLSSTGLSGGAMGQSVITANDAFDILGIPATYSVVSVYTDVGADNNYIASQLENMGLAFPHMIFENWASDMENFRIYNLLVAMFAIIFVCVLAIVGLILFLSQFYIKTTLSLPVYALYRINGLSLSTIMRSWIMQAILMYIIGVAVSIPLTIWLMNEFMAMLDLRNFLPVNAHAIVILSVLVMVLVSIVPSLVLLYKRKGNVVADVT